MHHTRILMCCATSVGVTGIQHQQHIQHYIFILILIVLEGAVYLLANYPENIAASSACTVSLSHQRL
jgi:hypothetical protein